MRRTVFILLLTLVALGCATASGRPPGVEKADVMVNSHAVPFFGSGTDAAMPLDVIITNRATVPVRIRSFKLTSSPAMSEYRLRTLDHFVGKTLSGGDSLAVAVTARAFTDTPFLQAREPLSVRVELDLEAAGVRYMEIHNIFQVGE